MKLKGKKGELTPKGWEGLEKSSFRGEGMEF